MQISLAELAGHLGAELRGDADLTITGVSTLKEAGSGEVAFLANETYRKYLQETSAGAVIVRPEDAEGLTCAAIVTTNPYLAFARTTQLFDNRPKTANGIHASAQIAESAVLGDECRIGANAVIGENVVLGDRCEIGAGTVIGDHSRLGNDCVLFSNVTVYHDVRMGDRVRIHSGTVIGADGFGFAPDKGRWEKIMQLGGVKIGSDVEIGANSCVDRGALGDTIIGDNVIIDNLVQVAHNVELGDGTAMASQAGVAGSTKLGKHCVMAGNAGVAGHLELCDGVFVGPKSVISKSINEPGGYATGTAQMPMNEWRKAATRFRQLDSMARRIQQLEKQLKEQGKD
ncbi:MAG: UDP-3-O-(3-hydroxymyristoyl)glucosamine N-acyltransferase [Thalassolituus sp.]